MINLKSQKFAKGFTLIELLVVIAIIGLLSSVVFASLSSARSKARDAHRKASAYEIRTALLLYHDDHGNFPKCGNFENLGESDEISSFAGFVVRSYDPNWDSCLAPALKPYIDPLVKDPINGMFNGLPIYYWYDCLAPSSGSLTCGDPGVRFNIYFETGERLNFFIKP